MAKLNSAPGLLESYKGRLEAKVELKNLDNNVRFSLKHCNAYLGHNDFCLLKVTEHEAENLYKRLGHFEEYTWNQIAKVDPKKGFGIEPRNTATYKKLLATFPNFSTFLHFRVNGVGTGIFRIFGARKDDLCYVLLFDRGGIMHYSFHK
jgi:hypothetical protein